jgi:hypothetical protein
MAALAAIVLAGLADMTPAAARDYPWCAQGGEYDYPGECAYSTYEQCQASVSGRLLFCDRNPRFAYGRDRPAQPHRRVRPAVPY